MAGKSSPWPEQSRGSGGNLGFNVPFSAPPMLCRPRSPSPGEQVGFIEASAAQGMADLTRHPDPIMETSGLANLWVNLYS